MVRFSLIAVAAALMVLNPAGQPGSFVHKYHETVEEFRTEITHEEQVLSRRVERAFTTAGVNAPVVDPNISAACRRLCKVLDCSQVQGSATFEPQTIQFTLRRFGVTDSFFFPVVAVVRGGDDAGALLEGMVVDSLASLGVNRYGLAMDEETGMLAAVFTKRLAQLGPFPMAAEPGTTHLLWGGLEDGASNAVFILSTPDEALFQVVPKSSRGIFWTEVYFPEQSGQYLVEILVQSDGPQVAALFPVYVGVPIPERPVFKLYPGVAQDATVAEMERQAIYLMNKERKKRSLAPLRADHKMARSARGYSLTMAEAGRLSHALETTPLAQRGDLQENISLSTTLAGAHANLMASPSHRLNILDDEANFCGVGIVESKLDNGATILYMTQRFRRAK